LKFEISMQAIRNCFLLIRHPENFTISEISADKGYGSVKNYKAIQRHGAVPYIAF